MSKSVSLRAQLEFPKVDRTVSKENHLMISLTAPELDADKRIPVQIVLVLDVSGSMSEGCAKTSAIEASSILARSVVLYSVKTKLEVMKSVATKLIEHLRDTDRISIVAFDTFASPVINVSGNQKEQAIAAISKLQSGSMTNTSGGITSGYEQVKTDFVGSTRILLMTDGHANHGVSDRDGLIKICEARPGTAILSTFGFGNSANQELLADMAKAGGGNYHYIDDPDQVRNAFAEELGGAVSCVAQNIKITVGPSKDVKIIEVLNDFKIEDNNGDAVIVAEDIYAGETKHILVKLSLPAVPNSKPRPSTVVSLSASWFDVLSAKQHTLVSQFVKVEYVKPENASKEAVLEVAEQIAILTTAKKYRDATLKADAGDFAGAAVACASVGDIWEDLRLRGSALGTVGMTNNNMVSASLESQNYSVSEGNNLRYASRNSLRSRSMGSAGSSNLGIKTSSVKRTLKDFVKKNETIGITTVKPSKPLKEEIVFGSPSHEQTFIKDRIRK